jgi:hypothetical protein
MTLPTREYDLFTQNRPGYFYARVRAVSLNPQLVPGLFADIRTAILEKRVARLLFEFEMAHALSEDETYELMNQLIARFPGMRIALVSNDPRHRPLLHLSAHLGFNKGDDIGSFVDPALAETWLLED